jgi:hypothetical protein
MVALGSAARPLRGELRRILTALADSHSGELHSALLANGVTRSMLSATIGAGYAVAVKTVIRAGGKTIPISHVKITDAGRQALLLWPKSGTAA